MKTVAVPLTLIELSNMRIALDMYRLDLQGYRLAAKKTGDHERMAELDGDIKILRNLRARLFRAGRKIGKDPEAEVYFDAKSRRIGRSLRNSVQVP